jgi:hypothetical protein
MTAKTVEDLFLAADLDRLDCGAMADQIRSAKTHDDVACLVMACRELLEQASASPELLALVVAADETNFEEMERQDQLRREQALKAGAEARADGRIAPGDLELLAELRAMGSEWADFVTGLEGCTSKDDVEKVRFLLWGWVSDGARQMRDQAAAVGVPGCREEDVERVRALLCPAEEPASGVEP